MKNISISNNLNLTKNNNNILKKNKAIKTKIGKDSSSNLFRKKLQKNKISSLNLNSNKIINNTTISNSVPYHHILGDLIKYLENKINSSLFEDINNYVNKKINIYHLENIENSKKNNSKATINLNKNINNTGDAFSDKKYKSYMNFNIFEKRSSKKIHNNFLNKSNNYIKAYNSIKSSKLKKEKLLKKLMKSDDCINKKLNILKNKKKLIYNHKINNKDSYLFTINSLNHNQDSQLSFENYYNGSSENIQKISYGYHNQKIENKKKYKNKIYDTNDLLDINLYTKLKPINKNNIRLIDDTIEINLKNRQKNLYNKKSFNNNQSYKSKSIRNIGNKKNYNRYKMKIISNNNDKFFNVLKKGKINSKNKTFINNEYKNDNLNDKLNDNFKNKNLTINLNLGEKSFINKKTLLNKKLINKLKINLPKNKNYFNNKNILKSKRFILNNFNIFNEFCQNKNINRNNKLNNTLTNINRKTINLSNIKKEKNYRLNNSNIKAISSLKKKLISKAFNKDIISKLHKKNFLNIVNNITNKKNIDDKKFIHINNIEINNIIKSNESKDVKKEIL